MHQQSGHISSQNKSTEEPMDTEIVSEMVWLSFSSSRRVEYFFRVQFIQQPSKEILLFCWTEQKGNLAGAKVGKEKACIGLKNTMNRHTPE